VDSLFCHPDEHSRDLRSRSVPGSECLAKDKIAVDAPVLNDASEQFAKKFDMSVTRHISTQPGGPKLRCVWNDTVRAPSSRLLSIGELEAQIAKIEA